ncbi:hypothetical protein EAH83_09785 [Variovorax ginsengisoli]|uniref:Uncharacterized protein n=2 Tax=Variovorax guangxiensis TaxID=1775474 RepID=A0A502DUI2_9BURK|nr:DUF6152 family protein [Variovorax guangxiensis]TPG24736.1 hypothetical protein EAH83_09785 [Variovorax ginsengisoli]TPG28987.1 hypothetical protein EAH82_09445 [Variovorax guangxiensis]
MPMSRRRFVLATAAASATPLALPPAWAHHGWSSFDADRPIYLEGKVVSSKWQNPHAELMLDLSPGLALPADLKQRPLPAQSAGVDGPALLAKTVLPKRKDRRWELELAPLTRMSAWKVAEIKAGDPVSAVGFTFKDEAGDAVMRVEYLFASGKSYGLRSSPV